MKTKTLYPALLLFLIMGFITTQCKKDDDTAPIVTEENNNGGSNNTEEPDTTGNNENNMTPYYSCKVNGEELQVSSSGMTCFGVTCYYYPNGYFELEPGYFTLSGHTCGATVTENVNVNMQGISEVGEYDLKTAWENNAGGGGYLNTGLASDPDFYSLRKTLSGTLVVTSLIQDPGQGEYGWIEGTFEFSVIYEDDLNAPIDTVVYITEGKFGRRL